MRHRRAALPRERQRHEPDEPEYEEHGARAHRTACGHVGVVRSCRRGATLGAAGTDRLALATQRPHATVADTDAGKSVVGAVVVHAWSRAPNSPLPSRGEGQGEGANARRSGPEQPLLAGARPGARGSHAPPSARGSRERKPATERNSAQSLAAMTRPQRRRSNISVVAYGRGGSEAFGTKPNRALSDCRTTRAPRTVGCSRNNRISP